MKRRDIYPFLVFMLFLLLPGLLQGGEKPYRVIGGPDDFYFGHISYIEPLEAGNSALIIREGQEKPEEAILNLPLGPGDGINSRDGRLELQFDNGTIVRLDRDTELRIETILAPSLSSSKKVSNLVLSQGSIYVMYKKYSSLELFQILTPVTAVKMDHHSVALIQVNEDGSSEVQLERGRAWILADSRPKEKFPQELMLEKGNRVVVSVAGEVMLGELITAHEFLEWNYRVNENFDLLHEESFLPKPLQKLPPAVFYFAQKYGSLYGEWVWHDLYGYVWRPFYNDYYPWGTWQPYLYGRWIYANGSLFWVPEEPWGWVPYHLGLWMWDKNKGWIWIPGSLFAPAWAVWDFYFGYYAWRPWSLYDWYLGTTLSPFGYSSSLSYYYSGIYTQVPSPPTTREFLDKIRKDQLKKPSSSEKVPVPKEMKKIVETALTALQKGDERAVESFRRTITGLVLVSPEDFGPKMPREKLLRFNEAMEKGKIAVPARPSVSGERPSLRQEVLQQLGKVEGSVRISRKEPGVSLRQKNVGRQVQEIPLAERSVFARSARMRLLDWNPDVRIASRFGVDIVYDSRRNEVRCPQLGLSSRDISRRFMLSFPEGGFMGPGNPFSPGYSSGTASSPSLSSGGAGHSGLGTGHRENSGGGRTGEKK